MSQLESSLYRRLAIEARRIARQHLQIRELLAECLEAARRSGAPPIEALSVALTAHFDLEERVHIPALHGAEPEQTAALDRLISDHEHFRAEVVRIRERFESGDGAAPADLERLASDLRDHEAREEQLFPKV